MMQSHSQPCPCCSNKTYDECCRSFHIGTRPTTALELMRSRYSAYVLNMPDYIIATTHPASPEYSDNIPSWKKSISQFSCNTVFENLKILDFKEHDTMATVVFTAYMQQQGQDVTFAEKSYFEKKNGRWLYRGGQLTQGYAPSFVTAKPLRLLPLAYYGELILRQKGEPIQEITDSLRTLVDAMIETMDCSDGIGLAAPQVHHSIRLFIVRTPIEHPSGEIEYGEVKVFINPKISYRSEKTASMEEGCLSLPTIRATVDRPQDIVVEYTTITGERVQEHCHGLYARIILHEYDHIEGILFTDHLPSRQQQKLAPLLQQLEKRIHDGKAL